MFERSVCRVNHDAYAKGTIRRNRRNGNDIKSFVCLCIFRIFFYSMCTERFDNSHGKDGK